MSVSKRVLDDVTKLRLQEAWQGEVFGMAMYRAIATRQNDPIRRWQWQALYQLEVETGAAMRQLLLRHGQPVQEQEASARAGLAEAERLVHLPWRDMMVAFADDLPSTIDDYRALEQACAFVGEDAMALSLLVNHEVVSLEFANAEIRGESQNSIKPVLAMLKLPPILAL